MKRLSVLLAALFLLTAAGTAFAQADEGDVFVQNLVRELERRNWDASETGQLVRNLAMYEWKNLSGVDPEIVAFSLSYCRERGVDDPAERAALAWQLTERVREMKALGLESRDIAQTTLKGIRIATTTRNQLRAEEEAPDLAQQIREQVRREIGEAQGRALQRQMKKQVSGSESPNGWTPPGPGKVPGPARGDGANNGGAGTGAGGNGGGTEGNGNDAGGDAGTGAGGENGAGTGAGGENGAGTGAGGAGGSEGGAGTGAGTGAGAGASGGGAGNEGGSGNGGKA